MPRHVERVPTDLRHSVQNACIQNTDTARTLLIAQRENEELASAQTITLEELDTTRQILDSTGADNKQLRKDLAQSQEEIALITEDLAQTKKDLVSAREELAETKEELAGARDELADAKSAVAALEAEHEVLQRELKDAELSLTQHLADLAAATGGADDGATAHGDMPKHEHEHVQQLQKDLQDMADELALERQRRQVVEEELANEKRIFAEAKQGMFVKSADALKGRCIRRLLNISKESLRAVIIPWRQGILQTKLDQQGGNLSLLDMMNQQELPPSQRANEPKNGFGGVVTPAGGPNTSEAGQDPPSARSGRGPRVTFGEQNPSPPDPGTHEDDAIATDELLLQVMLSLRKSATA